MRRRDSFCPGISSLLDVNRGWLEGRRIGLVSHPAAVDCMGAPSAELLLSLGVGRLGALFGPEHGFLGAAAAGRTVAHAEHSRWGIPVYSLYGEHRRPGPAMLDGLDTIVFDIQNLAARPYTYVATLRYLLEAAAEQDKTIIVADRPVPLPSTVDGPMLDPRFESFVGAVPVPMVYGMTPGEAATWLKQRLEISVDLKIAGMGGYMRQSAREPGWPPWVPPSPEIKSWESGCCYAATVFAEAVPVIDNGRGTAFAYQVLGTPWMKAEAVCERMSDAALPGVKFYPHDYVARVGALAGQVLSGVRLCVIDPDVFLPVTTAVHMIACLQGLHGADMIWRSPGVRALFFDKLFGTDSVRESLVAGERPGAIVANWRAGLAAYGRSRQACLLYDIEVEDTTQSNCAGCRVRDTHGATDRRDAEAAAASVG